MYHDHFVPDEEPCPLAVFSAPGEEQLVKGTNLVHVVDQKVVEVGQDLTFTAWVLNSSNDILSNVTVDMRSFTNEADQRLVFDSQPSQLEITGQTLMPGRALTYTFIYRVEPKDAEDGGLLINALRVHATTPTYGRIVSDCDAYAVAIHVPNLSDHEQRNCL